ncbi:hypothetical protein NA78x_003694 [Anatilimnocola sp. NA78]|uniref:hypothetical protein n=1 Tax=Anatilimnocola sp. NA78 TaxID=3415683 RepID=UPI003CE51CB4
MENRKPPTEDDSLEWLRKAQLSLPPLRFKLTTAQPRYPGSRKWDFEIEAVWDNQSAVFAVEYKSLFNPKAFDEALGQCRSAVLPPNHFPLLLMPYLRTSQLEELESYGISGVDWCGNGVVIVPGRFRVFRTGNRNQFATYARIKNIYRKNTSMVARALLSASPFSSVQEILTEVNFRNVLAKTTGKTPMSLGTVSKALKELEDELIVDRSQGIRLLQADKLLDQLEQNYEPPKNANRVRLKVDCEFNQLPQLLNAAIGVQDSPLVATGLSSVTRYATMQREEVLSIYCPQLQAVRAAIGGRETNRFPNLELIETTEQSLYFDARQDGEPPLAAPFYWASPTQTYLELMHGDKRDRETADQVRDNILRHAGAGS